MNQAERFLGKLAVVTGSTAGIGLGIAKRLAQEGAKVVISSRHHDRVQSAVESLRSEGLDVVGCECNVGKDEQRRKLIDLATSAGNGKIDFLVLSAGVNPAPKGGILEMPEWAIDKVWDINVKSGLMLVREASSYFGPGSSIVFNSSIQAFGPVSATQGKWMGMYGVAKSALLNLTKVLANELGPRGVRVNCIAPGLVPTTFSSKITADRDFARELGDQMSLEGWVTVDSVAGTVAFLVSSDARYITGETVVIAGGQRSRL